jgi:hypothetical protein
MSVWNLILSLRHQVGRQLHIPCLWRQKMKIWKCSLNGRNHPRSLNERGIAEFLAANKGARFFLDLDHHIRQQP